jgi:hypothetical protein
MTIAGVLFANTCPILFGDVLLSGPIIDSRIRLDNNRIIIPAKGIVDVYENESDQDASLARKVVIINGHLAIAWSGSYQSAAVLISELQNACGHTAPNNETLESLLLSIPYEVRQELAVLLCYKNDNGYLATISWGGGFDHPNNPHYVGDIDGLGRVIIIGSKARMIARYISSLVDFTSGARDASYEATLRKAFSLISYLIGDEGALSYNKRRDYGAFFELIYYKNRFHHFENYTIRLWVYDKKTESLHLLPHAFNARYDSNILVVDRIALKDNDQRIRIAKWEEARMTQFRIAPPLIYDSSTLLSTISESSLTSPNHSDYVVIMNDIFSDEAAPSRFVISSLFQTSYIGDGDAVPDDIVRCSQEARDQLEKAVQEFLAMGA